MPEQKKIRNKLDLTWTINSQETYEKYLIYRKEKLSVLFDTPNSFLEKILLSGKYHEIYLCTARRIGKTYKVLALMLFDLLHLPWYNACCVRKYQQQVEKNLLKPMLQVLQDFIRFKIVPEKLSYMLKTFKNNIVYQQRHILFASIENPANTLGTVATNLPYEDVQPLYCTLFVDEVVQAGDKMTLSAQRTIDNIKIIKDSIFRGLNAPFGIYDQEIYACNPWDFQNLFYAKFIERYVPVGTHYVSVTKENEVRKNFVKLLKPPFEAFNVFNEEGRNKVVYRCSSKLIPKNRWSAMLEHDYKILKQKDYDSWLCVYNGIHGATTGIDSTYLPFMSKRPIYENEKARYRAIFLGLDRGMFDDTVLSIVGLTIFEGETSICVRDGLIFSGTKNRDVEFVINEIINFLIKFKDENPELFQFNNLYYIYADPSAYEFNKLVYLALRESIVTNNFEIVKARRHDETKKGWSLRNRQDFMNQMFSSNKFKFDKRCNKKFIEKTWLDFQNCLSKEDGRREERARVNKLDIINSIEYALSMVDADTIFSKEIEYGRN